MVLDVVDGRRVLVAFLLQKLIMPPLHLAPQPDCLVLAGDFHLEGDALKQHKRREAPVEQRRTAEVQRQLHPGREPHRHRHPPDDQHRRQARPRHDQAEPEPAAGALVEDTDRRPDIPAHQDEDQQQVDLSAERLAEEHAPPFIPVDPAQQPEPLPDEVAGGGDQREHPRQNPPDQRRLHPVFPQHQPHQDEEGHPEGHKAVVQDIGRRQQDRRRRHQVREPPFAALPAGQRPAAQILHHQEDKDV